MVPQYIPEDYIHDRAEYFRNELKEVHRQLNKYSSIKPRDESGDPRAFTRKKLERIKVAWRSRAMFLMDAMRALNIKRGDELDAE